MVDPGRKSLREPKTVDVPMPGDGRYWEQIKINGEYEYVFYQKPSPIRAAEGLIFNKYHTAEVNDKTINYHPMPNPPWADIGEPIDPAPRYLR